MRQKIKEQLFTILDSMLELHRQCLSCSADILNELMQDCQQAAIAVGETLEHTVPEEEEAVSQLEKYCEKTYQLTEKTRAEVADVEELDETVLQVRDRLLLIRAQYQVVFFPYKAEMWDSLESIWLACKADDRCQCLVVPIPYFSYDASKKQLMPCYDGEKFPEYVPIVSYMEYSMENENPDIVYIHNPYDNCNLVTSVHPHFYSSEIRKYAEKLVYVPYYVTTGQISREHLFLPVHQNMDYMIAQSEYFKEGCRGMFYYDKVLPLGSPKLDKVIRLCGESRKLPEEWKAIEGKKKLMLNTSINCLLQHGEIYLRKLRKVFEWVHNHTEIAIVWRPHPLLESTMQAMRTDLLREYRELIALFESEQIGILDKTPDIALTIAMVDGYIGEEATSVVNLFGAVGKPLFILNNFIVDRSNPEWKRRIRISDMCYVQGKWWMVSSLYNGLFALGEDWTQISFAGRVDGQPKWCGAYLFLQAVDNKIYLSPGMAKNPVCYREKEGDFRLMPLQSEKEELLFFKQVIVYKNSVFYISTKNGAIWEYHNDSEKWICHTECVEALKSGISPQKYEAYADIFGVVQDENCLYLTAEYTNRVLCFYMDDGSFTIEQIGDTDWGYSGIEKTDELLWLAETHSGAIICKNLVTDELVIYDMPNEFCIRQQGNGSYLAHSALLSVGDYIVTIPAFSNRMIRINRLTGEISLLAPAFFEESEIPKNDYHPKIHTSSCFAKKWENDTILVQRTCDDALAVVNVETGKYKVTYPAMSEQAYDELLRDQDGFERPGPDYYAFARRESRLFPISGFMNELLYGELESVKARQLKELSSFAANLDGTCGEKVHAFMMNALGENKNIVL